MISNSADSKWKESIALENRSIYSTYSIPDRLQLARNRRRRRRVYDAIERATASQILDFIYPFDWRRPTNVRIFLPQFTSIALPVTTC